MYIHVFFIQIPSQSHVLRMSGTHIHLILTHVYLSLNFLTVVYFYNHVYSCILHSVSSQTVLRMSGLIYMLCLLICLLSGTHIHLILTHMFTYP